MISTRYTVMLFRKQVVDAFGAHGSLRDALASVGGASLLARRYARASGGPAGG